MRPATPIKAVLGNFYGEVAGFENQTKTIGFRLSDEQYRLKSLNPSKEHTRASAMANSYVNRNIMKFSTAQKDLHPSQSLFKMKIRS